MSEDIDVLRSITIHFYKPRTRIERFLCWLARVEYMHCNVEAANCWGKVAFQRVLYDLPMWGPGQKHPPTRYHSWRSPDLSIVIPKPVGIPLMWQRFARHHHIPVSKLGVLGWIFWPLGRSWMEAPRSCASHVAQLLSWPYWHGVGTPDELLRNLILHGPPQTPADSDTVARMLETIRGLQRPVFQVDLQR